MKNFKYEKENSPGYLFWKLSVRWSRVIKKELDKYDLTHTQFVILSNILYIGKCSQSVLSNETGIDKMTLSSTIRLLEKKDLIIRNKDINDKRKVCIELTDNGKTLIKKTLPVIENIDEKFFVSSNKELLTFSELITNQLL